MPLTRDITIQQGDSTSIVVPIFDSDRDGTFWPDIDRDELVIEVTFAADDDRDAVTFVETDDVETRAEAFGEVDLRSDRFDFDGVGSVDNPDEFEIPDDQEVAVVELDANDTDELPVTDDIDTTVVYHVWAVDSGPEPDERFTAVEGSVEVNGRPPHPGDE